MKAWLVMCAASCAAVALDTAQAQGRNDLGVPDIMVEEGSRPAKRQKQAKPAAEKSAEPKEQAQPRKPAEPAARPRGSGYVPSTTLPRTEPVLTAPAPRVYTPPPINSFGDRVIDCNHSFPLRAGVGNNPAERGAYVRQCAN